MPESLLDLSPEALEATLAARASKLGKALPGVQPPREDEPEQPVGSLLDLSPDDIEARLAPQVDAAAEQEPETPPLGDSTQYRMYRFDQPILRLQAGFAEQVLEGGATVADEVRNMTQFVRNLFVEPEQRTAAEPVPRINLVGRLEERGILLQANLMDEIAEYAGGVAAFIAPFGAVTRALKLAGLARYASEAAMMGAATVAETRRHERLTGVDVGFQETALNAFVSGAMIPVGAGAGRAATAAVERLMGGQIGKATKELIVNSSIGALFEGGTAAYQGVDLTSPEGVKRLAGGIIGFNLGNAVGSVFPVPARPHSDASKARAIELTAELAAMTNLGIPKPKGKGAAEVLDQLREERIEVDPQLLEMLGPQPPQPARAMPERARHELEVIAKTREELATNYVRNLATPIAGPKMTATPETLTEMFGIPIETSRRVLKKPFTEAEQAAWRADKMNDAAVILADQLGPLAVAETKYRRGLLRGVAKSRHEEARKSVPQEELDSLVPTDRDVRASLDADPNFAAIIDGRVPRAPREAPEIPRNAEAKRRAVDEQLDYEGVTGRALEARRAELYRQQGIEGLLHRPAPETAFERRQRLAEAEGDIARADFDDAPLRGPDVESAMLSRKGQKALRGPSITVQDLARMAREGDLNRLPGEKTGRPDRGPAIVPGGVRRAPVVETPVRPAEPPPDSGIAARDAEAQARRREARMAAARRMAEEAKPKPPLEPTQPPEPPKAQPVSRETTPVAKAKPKPPPKPPSVKKAAPKPEPPKPAAKQKPAESPDVMATHLRGQRVGVEAVVIDGKRVWRAFIQGRGDRESLNLGSDRSFEKVRRKLAEQILREGPDKYTVSDPELQKVVNEIVEIRARSEASVRTMREQAEARRLQEAARRVEIKAEVEKKTAKLKGNKAKVKLAGVDDPVDATVFPSGLAIHKFDTDFRITHLASGKAVSHKVQTLQGARQIVARLQDVVDWTRSEAEVAKIVTKDFFEKHVRPILLDPLADVPMPGEPVPIPKTSPKATAKQVMEAPEAPSPPAESSKHDPGPVMGADETVIPVAKPPKKPRAKPKPLPRDTLLPALLLGTAGGTAIAASLAEDDDEDGGPMQSWPARLAAAGIVMAPFGAKRGGRGRPPSPQPIPRRPRFATETALERLMAEQVRNAPPPVPIVKATTRAEVDAELAKPMPRGSRAKIEKLDGLADKLGLANDEVVAEWAPTKPNAARNQLIDEWLLTVGGAISSYSKELAARTQRGLRRFAVEFRKLEDWTKHFDKDFDFSRELSDVHAPGKQSEYMDSHRMYTQLWERLRGAGIWRMRVKDLESRIKTARPDEAEAFRELEARATRRIQEMDAVVVEKPKSEQAQVVALAMGSRMFGVSLSDMRKVLTWQPSEKVMRGAKAYRRMVDIAFTEFAKRAIDSKIPFDTWKKGAYLPGAIPRWIMEIPTSSKLVPGSVERQQALQARMRDNMAIAASDLMDVPVPYAVNMLNQAKHFRADRQFYQVSINDAVAKKFGAIDFHRSLHTDVGIEIDFARMVRSYFRPGLLRINTAREFGPNTEIAADLIRKAGAEGKNVVELTRLFDVATGQTPRLLHGQQNRILAELSGLVGIKHLGSSWLPQFIATGHIWAESGFKDLVRALPGSFRASIAQSSIAPRAMRETEQNVHWRKFVNKSGSMSQQELVSVFSEMSAFSPKIAAMLLRYPYLTGPVDRWTRNLAAIAGTLNTERVLANYRHHLAQGNKVRARLERQRLQERFGEDPKILQAALDPRLPKANLEELAFLGGQIIGERAVGRNFAFDLPLAAADPFLGHVFKLSQYVIRQTARSLRAADPLNEASVVRNPATWLRYLSGIAAAMGMSYGVLHLRELIVNGDAEKLSKDPIWRRTKDVISYGGLYSQVYDGWDLATGRYGPVGEKILGPTFGLGLDFVSAAANMVNFKERPGQAVPDVDFDPTPLYREAVLLMPKGLWNAIGVPKPLEIADEVAPRKRRQRPVRPPSVTETRIAP